MPRRILLMALLTASVATAGCEDWGRRHADAEREAGMSATGSAVQGSALPEEAPGRVEGASAISRPSEGRSCFGRDTRIGNFDTPEPLLGYEIMEITDTPKRASRNDPRVAELLVDTRARSEADYALITRNVKARYAGYDAVTVRFTNLRSKGIPYNGGALIFNTPCGALHLGYVYGPPNRDGYVVAAGGPPQLYPSKEPGRRERPQ